MSARWKLLAAALAALAVLAGGGLLAWRVLIPDTVDAVDDARAGEAEAIIAARAAVQTRMTEATSFEFGKPKVVWQGEKAAVCGTVDIEEEQDSFEGYERFVYLDGRLTLEEVDGTDAIEKTWKDICD